MNVIDKIISVIAPYSCIGCGIEENQLLCEGCRNSLPLVPSRCYKCRAVTENFAVCRACQSATPLRTVVVHTHYQDMAKELVHRLKYERARQGIEEMTAMLRSGFLHLPADVVITYVPTATSRVRTRGYDHAKLLAGGLRNPDVPVKTLLVRVGQAHQVGARRAERLRQLEHAFRVVHSKDIKGKHVVLVDDVVTTGATLEMAARALRRAGAKRVSAVVFAQA